MKKVLIATEKPFSPDAVRKIKGIADQAGYDLALLESYSQKSDLLKAVESVDALIIRSDIVDAEVMDAAKNLKIVVRAGSGYDNIDLPSATAHNVAVMNTPGQNANAVAELAIGMMIYQARKHFNGKLGTELRGKTLGIHGYGNVGKSLSAIARGIGMIVYEYDPFLEKEEFGADGVYYLDSMDELYRISNYVSLHIPATAETMNSVNYRLLSSMPEPATLVNTARKEIVNEADLLKMFADRPDFEYIADIEPDCVDEIKEKYTGRYFFTPKKMGAQTEEANMNAGLAAIRQIINFFEKGDVRFQVNK